MTTTSVYRISAVALIASFVLSLVGGVFHPVIDGHAHSVDVFTQPVWPQLLIYAGAIALMIGLPGCYAWFRERLGRLGFVGFALYFVGNALSAQAHLVVEGFIAPTLAASPEGRAFISDQGEIIDAAAFITLQTVGGLVFIAGLLIIGLALLLRRGLPTWLGVVMLAGAVALFIPWPEAPVFSGLLVELPRGLTVAVLAMIMIRELRSTGAVGVTEVDREPVAVAR